MTAPFRDVAGPGIVVLTGAGLSTDSGIPDYRGPGAPARTPMTFQEFVSGPEAQQRYWARAHVGWSHMRDAVPNAGHHALARLQADGRIGLVITQNVDGLHEAAGTQHVVTLHGRVAEVVCLDCRTTYSRQAVQAQMRLANPDFIEEAQGFEARPDGDAELANTESFHTPACPHCGGRLKPDVVFFGENVPRDRVARCIEAVERADALLVVGSSLTVMSGLRFVRQAAKRGIPIVIVNRGQTRGDDLATEKFETGCSEFLTDWAEDLVSSS